MKIIEIEQLDNGAHRNQDLFGATFPDIPNGWAIIPDDMSIPDTFPFVDIEVEDGVVVSMSAGVVPEPEPEPEPEETMENKIEALKAQLSATDYQIIKCSEYQLMGLDLPYNVATLHAQRQALRDEINALEEEKENKEAGADETQ